MILKSLGRGSSTALVRLVIGLLSIKVRAVALGPRGRAQAPIAAWALRDVWATSHGGARPCSAAAYPGKGGA